jgi:peptidoglycan/xylan/chitin deacetylase (PgdA/CDA1 family)
MSRRTTSWLKAALQALHYSGADGLFAPLAKTSGAIFMLHQVVPGEPDAFEPNRILRITPAFLDQTIRQVLEAGFDILSLDEIADRLTSTEPAKRPFVGFTLDDGYRDNLVHAYPVFKRLSVPFTVYAPTDYIDGIGELWWLALERALRVLPACEATIDGETRQFSLTTPRDKDRAYHTIYWWLRQIDETVARRTVKELCARAGVDEAALCRDMIMTWDELKTLAADPLVTIGAHTRRHYALARLGAGAAHYEMAESVRRLEQELQRPIHHFSYPFGDEQSAGPRDFAIARDLGLRTAVTTRKGLLHGDHSASMHALPRLSLNGDYQDARYVKVLLSGVPFLLRDAAHRLVTGRASEPVRAPA